MPEPSPQPPNDYDWRLDAYRSWELAIAELRAKGLRDGWFPTPYSPRVNPPQ